MFITIGMAPSCNRGVYFWIWLHGATTCSDCKNFPDAYDLCGAWVSLVEIWTFLAPSHGSRGSQFLPQSMRYCGHCGYCRTLQSPGIRAIVFTSWITA